MAKMVASRWLSSISKSEYRFTIFGFQHPSKAKKFASSLRSLRDRELRTGSSNNVKFPPIPDLGVREMGDGVVVWSSNVEALRKLANWAEESGLNTDFIW